MNATTETDTGIKVGDSVRVRGFQGIACVFRGHPVEAREVWVDDGTDEDGNPLGFYDSEELERTDRAIVVMVGDDRKHTVDVEDLEALPDEDYCGECGQIGCTHDGKERE
jgi:hypothetical protein